MDYGYTAAIHLTASAVDKIEFTVADLFKDRLQDDELDKYVKNEIFYYDGACNICVLI